MEKGQAGVGWAAPPSLATVRVADSEIFSIDGEKHTHQSLPHICIIPPQNM